MGYRYREHPGDRADRFRDEVKAGGDLPSWAHVMAAREGDFRRAHNREPSKAEAYVLGLLPILAELTPEEAEEAAALLVRGDLKWITSRHYLGA